MNFVSEKTVGRTTVLESHRTRIQDFKIAGLERQPLHEISPPILFPILGVFKKN